MSKYDAICDFLRSKAGTIEVSLAELSDLVVGGLPPSPYNHEAWWSNDDDTHTQSRSWSAAGYHAEPDLVTERVRFVPCS
jgi:hypothetical protein